MAFKYRKFERLNWKHNKRIGFVLLKKKFVLQTLYYLSTFSRASHSPAAKNWIVKSENQSRSGTTNQLQKAKGKIRIWMNYFVKLLFLAKFGRFWYCFIFIDPKKAKSNQMILVISSKCLKIKREPKTILFLAQLSFSCIQKHRDEIISNS